MRPILHSVYSPVCWMLVISLFMLIYFLLRAKWKSRSKLGHFFLICYAIGWLLFYGVSTPYGSNLIHGTLIVEGTSALDPESWDALTDSFEPEYILVAAMGYLVSEDSATDVLRDGTALRVATAAKLYKRFPHATLVMQGAGISIDGEETARLQNKAKASNGRQEGQLWGELSEKDRQLDHQGRLMRAFAMSLGVPGDHILLEPYSTNTREHVDRILQFENIDSETPIAVVSSDWHMHRIQMVFKSAFTQVRFFGTAEYSRIPFRFYNFVPRERELYATSVYLREWVAITWYWLNGSGRSIQEEEASR